MSRVRVDEYGNPLNGCIYHWYGETFYYKEGLLHREDGPAVMKPNCNMWMQNGQMHNLDGPAYVGVDIEYGDRIEYWINGVSFTEKKFLLWKICYLMEE